jgi:hypothetical protein
MTMTTIPPDHAGDSLSDHELAELNQLEDQLGRGTAVHWDHPKTVRGFLARPIETATVKDYNDPNVTIDKKVATLRTEHGLQAIWEGPTGLETLFETTGAGIPVIVTYKGEKTSASTGRPYKAFDLIIGAAKNTADDEPGPADDIPYAPADDLPF